MRLTNTLSGAVEELEPLESGKIGIYVCGVTPYAGSHIGHAMYAIVYDVLVRYLRWPGNRAGGFDVTYVSNYTDVDDKIIERGHEKGRDPLELAQEHIDQWEREQTALGLLAPDVRPRVTEEIEAIVALIERIIEHDHAYATPQGNVYYRVRSKLDYGKLSRRDIDQLLTGTRFEPGEDKEFPLDFALWKAAKPGEPSWPSPWGDGRPGWHIECSAMSQRYLGDAFDIHGGGLDLVFPHHENEIAQSEAAGAPFARLWVHNGLVQQGGEKMARSVGNVLTVEEALNRWSPDAIRLFVLNSHYRSPSVASDEAMQAAVQGAERLTNALRPPADAPAGDGPALDASTERERFIEAMEDDFNTPRGLAALFDLARAINRSRDPGQDVDGAQATLRGLAGLLGLRLEKADASGLDAIALSKLAARFEVACGGADVEETMEALLAHRERAREARDFALADEIREALAEAGVEVEDTAQGPRWSARA